MSEAGTTAWSVMCGLLGMVMFISSVIIFIKAVEVSESYGAAKKKFAKYWALGGVASVLSAVALVGGAVYLGALY